MFRIKLLIFVSTLVITFNSFAQVGISTTTPEAALDVTSSNNGILIPRVALTSTGDVTTVTNPDGGGDPVVSTLVYNDGTRGLSPAGFYFWNGTEWSQLLNGNPSVYVGTARITRAGTIDVTGVPFQPKRVTFTAYANIEDYDINSDNDSGSNNNNDIPNTFGSMKGFAQSNGSVVDQQVIFNGGSGNSINDISRYASSSHCIGIRYTNNNGNNRGVTSAFLDSFNPDGFTLDVDSYVDGLVIIYEAYRY